MKKAVNKPGQLVRSASRRGKVASKFQFDFTVERLFPGQKLGNTYYVKWARGLKVAQTKPVLVVKDHKGGTKTSGGMPFDHKLSLIVTLYRTDTRFDEKDSKLSLISVNEKGQERTVAKMHFDLSAFAGVPSASNTKIFKLSDKASLKCTIDSRLLKSGPKGAGSGGASSMMSGMTGASDGEDPEDDFDDLDIADANDVPEPESPAAARAAAKQRSASKERDKSSPRLPAAAAASAFTTSAAVAAAPPPVARRQSSGGGGDGEAKLRAELAGLRDENDRVSMDLKRSQDKRKRLEAAHEEEIAKLRVKMAASAPAGGGAAAVVAERERRRAEEELAKASATAEALQSDLAAVRVERDKFRGEAEELQAVAKEAEKLRAQNKELGRDVDRLTVAASAGGGGGGESRVVQERLEKLQAEKEGLENKLRAYQAHSAKVKERYQQLTEMYNTLREDNIQLQGKMDDLEKSLEESRRASSVGVAGGGGGDSGGDAAALQLQLADAKQAVRDVEASKRSLERDMEHMKSQVESLQERLDRALAETDHNRKESDALAGKLAEMTSQRDAAVARAEKAGGKSGGAAAALSAEGELKLAEAIKAREQAERELVRMRQRISELEREVKDKIEDLEYEKTEKNKAREERDALRESARALERRTSQVSQTADAVHSLKRQLSTHKMREADQSAMISDLRDEVERLQSELDRGGGRGGGSGRGGDGQDDGAAVLEELVLTKMALATAEDEKLRLEFEIKTQRRNEKAIQEKLAAHASRLEVKLGEANDELAKARGARLSEDNSLF